jgi:hypothetical protein
MSFYFQYIGVVSRAGVEHAMAVENTQLIDSTIRAKLMIRPVGGFQVQNRVQGTK